MNIFDDFIEEWRSELTNFTTSDICPIKANITRFPLLPRNTLNAWKHEEVKVLHPDKLLSFRQMIQPTLAKTGKMPVYLNWSLQSYLLPVCHRVPQIDSRFKNLIPYCKFICLCVYFEYCWCLFFTSLVSTAIEQSFCISVSRFSRHEVTSPRGRESSSISSWVVQSVERNCAETPAETRGDPHCLGHVTNNIRTNFGCAISLLSWF